MRCNFPSSTTQQMKWNWISMCLVCAWYWCSYMSMMADWLSDNSVVALSVMPKSWVIREWSHSASFAAYIAAMYLLLVVESEIITCHLALQETAPLLMMNAYPDIAFLSLPILPSTSPYPINLVCHTLTRGPSCWWDTWIVPSQLPNEVVQVCCWSARQSELQSKCLAWDRKSVV